MPLNPSGFTLTWNERNQLSAISGGYEVYDGLGRREQTTSDLYNLSFLHDGGSVLGVLFGSSNYWNFLNLPGGGSLAGSNTVSSTTTTTLVPLTDTSGSTIALVNAAATGSQPATTYTYDPAGNPTLSGTASNWPFKYQGMEQELSDPAPYYYTGGGQFYSTQLVRSLSETSQTSSQGTGGGPAGGAIAAPSGGGNGSFGSWLAGDEENNLENYFSFGNLGVGVGGSESGFIVPVGAIAEIVEQWISFFDWLFGGGGPPPTPRKLLHQRHPLYPVILGIPDGLDPTEGSAAPTTSVEAAPEAAPNEPPPNEPPLQKPGYMTVQFHDYNYCGPGNNGGSTTPGTLDDCCRQHDNCYDQGGLSSNNVLPGHPGAGAGTAQRKCDQAFCDCIRFNSPIGLADRFLRYFAEGQFCY